MSLDPTASNPAPSEVQPQVVQPPAADPAPQEAAAVKEEAFKGPSFDDLKAKHPEIADDLTRLDASHRELHKRKMDEAKARQAELEAEVERYKGAAPAVPSSPLDIATLKRMVSGEDIVTSEEVAPPARPDFKAVVEEKIKAKGDAVLTDTAALAEILSDAVTAAYEKATSDSLDYYLRREKAAVKKLYDPVVQAHEAAAREEAVQRAVAEVRRLPGMDNDTAFDTVYDAMEKAGRVGVDGFKLTYAEMLAQNPAWVRPPAPKEPEVVVRPAPTVTPPVTPTPAPAPKQPTPIELAEMLSATAGSGVRAATRAPGVTIGTRPSRLEELMQDPAYLAEVSVDDGRAEWERHRDAQRRRNFSLGRS